MSENQDFLEDVELSDLGTDDVREANLPREIKNMAVLDLSRAKNVTGITSIKNVGMILIPENLAGELSKVSMKNVGEVMSVPAGTKVKTLIGQTKLTGEAFAVASEDESWIVVGQMHITTPVQTFTGAALLISGQVLAPRGSEAALTKAITKLSGQVVYVPPGSRHVMGQESWSREFLELLPEPSAFSIMGQVFIEDDVTVEVLRSKVTEISLMGQITAPQALMAILHVLTTEKYGNIVAKGKANSSKASVRDADEIESATGQVEAA